MKKMLNKPGASGARRRRRKPAPSPRPTKSAARPGGATAAGTSTQRVERAPANVRQLISNEFYDEGVCRAAAKLAQPDLDAFWTQPDDV